jgi:hypothetical protein
LVTMLKGVADRPRLFEKLGVALKEDFSANS